VPSRFKLFLNSVLIQPRLPLAVQTTVHWASTRLTRLTLHPAGKRRLADCTEPMTIYARVSTAGISFSIVDLLPCIRQTLRTGRNRTTASRQQQNGSKMDSI